MGKKLNALRKQVKNLEHQLKEMTKALAKAGTLEKKKKSKGKKVAVKAIRKTASIAKRKRPARQETVPDLQEVTGEI